MSDTLQVPTKCTFCGAGTHTYEYIYLDQSSHKLITENGIRVISVEIPREKLKNKSINEVIESLDCGMCLSKNPLITSKLKEF